MKKPRNIYIDGYDEIADDYHPVLILMKDLTKGDIIRVYEPDDEDEIGDGWEVIAHPELLNGEWSVDVIPMHPDNYTINECED